MQFKIGRPLKEMIITQPFGVNGDYYQKNGVNIKGHNGIDLRTPHGEPVYATHDGVALYQVDSKQGHGVVIITKESYEYDGGMTPFKTIYWHFCDPAKEPKYQSPIANRGAVEVKRGDLIGYADSTGLSSGDHLHFAVKPVSKVGENLWTWGPAEPNNGYGGCVDPMPYFEEPIVNEREKIIKAQIEHTQLQLIPVLNKFIEYLKEELRKKNLIK